MHALALLALSVSLAALGDERKSLQDLLGEARAARERIHAELQPKVADAVARLDGLERPQRGNVARGIVDGIVQLGLEAAPLLLPHLDPGPEPSRAQIFRSEQVAEALARLRAVSVTDPLLALARSGSLIGRLNALTVLGASPESERVAPALEALARSVEDSASNPFRPVRLAALRALARLGGPAAATLLADALRGPDPASAAAALEALIEERVDAAAPDVVALLSTARGGELASRIGEYMRVVPRAIALDGAAEATLKVCAQDNVSREAKLALLEVLRRSDVKPPSGLKRELATLRESLDQGVRVATLIYLARNKDRTAKRELFEPWDSAVRETRGGAQALEGRAEVNYKIGDYNAAVKDYRDALKAAGERVGGARASTPYIGLARSLTLLGKFKEAREYLELAPISLTTLHELAEDPDFADLRASKYGDVFRLPQ